MPARQRMSHRLYLQRNSASADAYGHARPPVWGALSTEPGYVWAVSEDTIHDASINIVSGRYRAMVALGTDVTERDRVEKVENRADTPTELFGVLTIDAVIRRRNHIELRLRSHS